MFILLLQNLNIKYHQNHRVQTVQYSDVKLSSGRGRLYKQIVVGFSRQEYLHKLELGAELCPNNPSKAEEGTVVERFPSIFGEC